MLVFLKIRTSENISKGIALLSERMFSVHSDTINNDKVYFSSKTFQKGVLGTFQ